MIAVFCRSTAQTFTLTAVGSPDASVSVPVTLEPWGAPNAPVFAPATLTQPAGSTATYAPTAAAAHACAATAGFPGADLVWLVDGGAPSVTVSTSATQVTVSSTDSCISASLDLTAKRRVNGFPTQLSLGAGHLEISLVPDWKPITAATAFDAGFSYDDAKSQLVGNFSTAANCADQRDLRAQVSVAGRDGGYVNSASGLPVPGAWSVNVPGGCSGGRFVATASLIDDAGTKYGATATYAFEAARIAARVPSLSVTEVPVSCAEGARGSLSLDLLPTDCAAQTYSWAQDIGPALVVVPDGGSTVSFATATQDLQAQAGQELGWSITATTGVGNSAVASRKVRLVPAPFVQISHRTDVPVAREEELVGVEVILTNPTACAVTGVVLRESLGGLKPVTGSVRVTGAKPEVTIVGDVLEVPGLALPALGSMSVTYLARVPLLSRARPRGQVLMTGADVTIDSPVTATGCGCDASSAGGFALMVLAAAMLRSRKRS